MQKRRRSSIYSPPRRLCELSPRSSAPLHLRAPPPTAQPRYRWKSSERTMSPISGGRGNAKWRELPATAACGSRRERSIKLREESSNIRLTPIIRSSNVTPDASRSFRCAETTYTSLDGVDKSAHRVRFYDYPEYNDSSDASLAEEDEKEDDDESYMESDYDDRRHRSAFNVVPCNINYQHYINDRLEKSLKAGHFDDMFEHDHVYSYSASVSNIADESNYSSNVDEFQPIDHLPPGSSTPPPSLPPPYESIARVSPPVESPTQFLREKEIDDVVGSDEEKGATYELVPFRVYVRVRPLDEQDIAGVVTNRPRTLTVMSKDEVVLSTRPSAKKENAGNKHNFHFDNVMNEFTSQREVFETTTQPLIQKMIEGYNTCLIAYGSQATGKTHSLFGKVSSGRHRAIITRSTEAVLSAMTKERSENLNIKLTMSFVQIFNEKLYDILDPSANGNIRFQEGDSPSSILDGVTEWSVEKVDDVTKQLRRNPNRVRESGRSHTVFSLRYQKEERIKNPAGDNSSTRFYRTIKGKIDFVDLVGVGRTTKHSTNDSTTTGNQGTAKTNKSLQTFHNVITGLVENDPHGSSYRDSKLTRMLKEALGGNCYTSLLVTASPCPNCAVETLTCLQFATKATSVQNRPCFQMSVREREGEEEEEKAESGATRAHEEDSPGTRKEEEEETLPPIEMKPYIISKNDTGGQPTPTTKPAPPSTTTAKKPRASPDSTSASSKTTTTTTTPTHKPTAKVEFFECRDKKNKPRQRGGGVVVEASDSNDSISNPNSSQQRKMKRKKRASSSESTTTIKSSSNKVQPFLQMSLDGKELSASSSSASTKILTLPRIETPEKTRREDPTSLAALRTRTPPPGKTILDVSSNFRLRNSVDSVIPSSGAVKAFARKSFGSKRVGSKPAFTMSSKNKTSIETETKESSRPPTPDAIPLVTGNCCEQCRVREDKIRANYDRMIMLSKRDRDEKEQRISELKDELHRVQNESSMFVENGKLDSEIKQLKQDIDVLQTDKSSLSSQLETLRTKLSKMVPSIELYNLQDLRRKETAKLEEQRLEIKSLQKNLADQTKGATKMLEKKSEQNSELEKEIWKLKQELNKKEKSPKLIGGVEFEKTLMSANDEKPIQFQPEKNLIKSQDEKVDELTGQIEKLRRENTKKELEKEQLAEEKMCISKALIAAQKQIEMMERGETPFEPRTKDTNLVDTGTNTEDFRHKLKGLAYYVYCLRCAAKYETNEEAPDSDIDAAKLRLLLMQDMKNQETLFQINRERNLLRDVMKIMYSRQWFSDEGKPHVKRALRRVGIDVLT